VRSVPLPDSRLRWALAALTSALALAATLSPPGAGTLPAPDWVFHALGFGLLAALYAFALDDRPPRTVLAGAFCLAVGLGGGIELLQPEFGRTASLADFLANAAGATLALVLYRAGHRWVRWA
jgi:VanZ family protein